eukprot:g2753.t1
MPLECPLTLARGEEKHAITGAVRYGTKIPLDSLWGPVEMLTDKCTVRAECGKSSRNAITPCRNPLSSVSTVVSHISISSIPHLRIVHPAVGWSIARRVRRTSGACGSSTALCGRSPRS